jgi:hypothetical protein
MSWLELPLIGAIIGGALYLLYRALWQKGGCCPGCDSRSCPIKPGNKDP